MGKLTSQIERQVVLHAIHTDVQYVGRLAGSAIADPGRPFNPIAYMCVAPYISLFAHESHERLRSLAQPATVPDVFTSSVRNVIMRSRNALKLFDDSRAIDDQLAWFQTEVISKHRARFIGKIWLKPLRQLGTDLGIYSYNNLPICTTHTLGLFLGVDNDILMGSWRRAKKIILKTYSEYGAYYASLGALPTDQDRSFIDHVEPSKLELDRDIRSEEFYRSIFNGPATPSVNALLCALQGLLNTVAHVLPLDREPASVQTIVKMQFLATYHVVASLVKLRAARISDLEPSSLAQIDQAIQHRYVDLTCGQRARPLRNSLMHYDVDSRIDTSNLTLDRLMYGMVEETLGITFGDFRSKVLELTQFLSEQMNRWQLGA